MGRPYQLSKDVWMGLLKSEALADHAIAFVMHGIVQRWKQPHFLFLLLWPDLCSDNEDAAV